MPDAPAPQPDLAAVLARLAAALERVEQAEAEGLAPDAAARFLGISVSKLHALNAGGLLPSPVELGDRCPRWSRTELRAWLLSGSPSRVRWLGLRDVALRRLPA